MIYNYLLYNTLTAWPDQPLPDSVILQDHLGGFEQNLTNKIFDALNATAGKQQKQLDVIQHNVLDDTVKRHYPNLNLKFDAGLQDQFNLGFMHDYNMHPEVNFKNFVCSFNGTPHISRKLLVSILQKFHWFDPEYCSKNFSYTVDHFDGHLSDYVDNVGYYSKFFIAADSEKFFNNVYSFGHVQFDHPTNIYNLENKLTQSFLHIVSETIATSYYPFVTEKFLYSIVTRGLFLTYAQPGWHAHIEKYYGFKPYTKLFDYRFDTIQNPVERLVELMSMISKFSVLSADEWKDLYFMEHDTIEYNYNHYFSRDYLTNLKQYE